MFSEDVFVLFVILVILLLFFLIIKFLMLFIYLENKIGDIFFFDVFKGYDRKKVGFY